MTKILLALILCLTNFTLAYNTGHTCNQPSPFLDHLKSLRAAVRVDELCEQAYELEAKNNYLQHFSKAETQISQLVEGKKLRGSDFEINTLKKMLGTKPPKAWSQLIRNCETVLCALERTFNSKEAAYRALTFTKTTGYIISLDQKDNPEGMDFIWPNKDVRIIDRVFSRLPKNFKHLPSLDVISRTPNNCVYSNYPDDPAHSLPRVTIDGQTQRLGEIRLFESFALQSERTSYTHVIHEVAHHLDFSHENAKGSYISDSKEFYSLSGWKKIIEPGGNKLAPSISVYYDYNEGHKFVRDYASEDPSEDFSESLAYYVMQPKKLLKLDPKKYNYYKNKIFNGQEYIQESNLDLACLMEP